MNLRPGEYFTVVRQLHNHEDVDTNYVRAVIRNARTDELLETLDLTDRGSRRFSEPWQVPADVSGQGFYISILTTVYTDSGYTTKNPNYGEEMSTYKVYDDALAVASAGGGGDIDYEKVRKILKEVLSGHEFPVSEKVDLGEVVLGLSALANLMSAFVEETKGYRENTGKSLAEQFASGAKAIIEARDAIVKAVVEKKIPDPTPAYDDTLVRDDIQNLSKVLGSENLKMLMEFAKVAPQLVEAFKGLDSGVKDFLMIMAKNGVKKPDRVKELLEGSKRS